MKILLCHNYYQHPGGESDVFENEVLGFRQMGNDVLLYCRQNSDIDQMPALKKLQLLFSAFSSSHTYQEVKALVQREKPDAAIVQNVFPLLSPSIYAALADAGIPVVQAVYNYRLICPSAELYTQRAICERCVRGNTTHAVVHRCYRNSYTQSAWYASIIGLHRTLGTFARQINSFMVPDEFLGTKLAEGGIPPSKIWRNPNPFFVENYKATSKHKGYVLFVGRLVEQKGILTLLEAMKRTVPSSRLLVVGQGELAEQIQDEIKSTELSTRVSWLGPRWGDELTGLIQDSAAVVIPSEWYDNLPVILCRANAMGKPVIASRINGIPEYVSEGNNGFLFQPGNSTELGRLIDTVLGLSPVEYGKLSTESRVFAEDVLDYSNHYKRLMLEFQKIKEGYHNG